MTSSLVEIQNVCVEYNVRRVRHGKSAWKSLFKSHYESFKVLKELNWILPSEKGITALLGKNGSGKTTLLKTLTGILTPVSGHLRVLGFEPWRREPRFLKQLGVVFGQKRILWPDLSLWENLRMTGALYHMERRKADFRIRELSELFGLTNLLDRPQKTLSLGESMKAELLNALLPQPRILFLDEPTVGLDVASQVKIRSMLKTYRDLNNCHILLTSHNMRDVAELADEIYLLDRGQITQIESHFEGRFLEAHLESRLLEGISA